MKRLIYSVVMAALVSGCATVQQVPDNPINNSDVINQSRDEVWGAAIAAVSERGLPIITADKNSGIISTQSVELQGGFNIPSRIQKVAYFTYKIIPFRDARYSLNVVVSEESADKTRIIVTAHIEGENYEKWITFKSKGIIEQEVIQEIMNRLKK
ncbi:MAG: hypothetical protein WC473_06000 [Patescibacteria group bacterium]|jgi:hypothetical protein